MSYYTPAKYMTVIPSASVTYSVGPERLWVNGHGQRVSKRHSVKWWSQFVLGVSGLSTIQIATDTLLTSAREGE